MIVLLLVSCSCAVVADIVVALDDAGVSLVGGVVKLWAAYLSFSVEPGI